MLQQAQGTIASLPLHDRMTLASREACERRPGNPGRIRKSATCSEGHSNSDGLTAARVPKLQASRRRLCMRLRGDPKLPNGLELCCPADRASPPFSRRRPGRPSTLPFPPASRVSISELFGGDSGLTG